ncbi:MAG: CPBP family intramembrane glutamic endopeptidase [Candidatus Zhuqueibacterota bacterium]
MTRHRMNAIFILVFLSIPTGMWLVTNASIQAMTFLLIGILAILSRYGKLLSPMRDSLEIAFLYFALVQIAGNLGLTKFFPVNNVFILCALYGFLFLLKKATRKSLYVTRGNIRGFVGLSIVCGLLSAGALAVWFYFQDGNPHARFVPGLPLPALLPLGLGFAVINASFEEGIFRSIFQANFSMVIGSGAGILLQALWFSFLHFQSGFPSGIPGLALTFVFGSLMGFLVNRTGGLLIPILIHTIADFSLFILIILRMNGLF